MTIFETRAEGMLSTSHLVFAGENEIARIKIGWRSSTIWFGSRKFEGKVRGIINRSYNLYEHNELINTAVAMPGLKTQIAFDLGGIGYLLKRKSLLNRGFNLESSNEPMGSLLRHGILRRRATYDLPTVLSPVEKLFLIWVTLETWQADDSSS